MDKIILILTLIFMILSLVFYRSVPVVEPIKQESLMKDEVSVEFPNMIEKVNEKKDHLELKKERLVPGEVSVEFPINMIGKWNGKKGDLELDVEISNYMIRILEINSLHRSEKTFQYPIVSVNSKGITFNVKAQNSLGNHELTIYNLSERELSLTLTPNNYTDFPLKK